MMNTSHLSLISFVCAALLGACASNPQQTAASQEQPGLLSGVNKRMNDETVFADHKVFNTLRARHEDLNKRGNAASSYGMAKTQCWQDVAFHEYTRNDRSAFPDLALRESVRLMDAIAAKSPVPQDTPLLDGAAKLRPDLWERTEKLKQHSGYECVADKVACGEVRLAHAGHEYVQGKSFREEGSWRYANPYVRMAEDLIGRAEREANACKPVPVVAAAPVAERRVITESVEIPVIVLFNFDKSDAANIRSFSHTSLERVISRIKNGELNPTAIEVTGHADRLNSTKDDAYNNRLAAARAATVSQLLASAGVNANLIRTASKGDSDQVETCKGKFTSQAEERECLLPNRRVEVRVLSEVKR
jgi:OmpA-OmpF porin, OOP family